MTLHTLQLTLKLPWDYSKLFLIIRKYFENGLYAIITDKSILIPFVAKINPFPYSNQTLIPFQQSLLQNSI